MNESIIVYVPRIFAFGIVLVRQEDGNYTANVKRSVSTTVSSVQNGTNGRDWEDFVVEVPWDVRIGQDWLRMFPASWAPLN